MLGLLHVGLMIPNYVRYEGRDEGSSDTCAANLANSAGVRVSGRRDGSMPAATNPSGVYQCTQAIAQRLTPLREGRRHRACKRRGHCECRFPAHGEARHGGPDARCGRERARADIEQMFGLEPGREHDGETAVGVAAGRGRDTVDDFLLQHHVQVVDVFVGGGDVKQQRRGDVVGQVADDAQPVAAHARQRREVEFERVGDVQLEGLGCAPARAQLRGEVPVDLDGIQRAGAGRSGVR